MTFAAEAFKNLDEALGMVEVEIRQGNGFTAEQGIKQIRSRLPSLLEGIEAERDRMLERREG
jgi:hypothetical protein